MNLQTLGVRSSGVLQHRGGSVWGLGLAVCRFFVLVSIIIIIIIIVGFVSTYKDDQQTLQC